MIEGEQRFFFQLLEVGQRANRVETLREETRRAVLELHSVLDATRVELDEARDDPGGISLTKKDLEWALVEATTEAGDLRLQKLGLEASFWRLSDQVNHTREEASRLSSELDVEQAKQNEAVDRAATTREEVLQFFIKLFALRSEVKALRARGADPSTDEESSHAGLKAMRGEASTL
ncbi:hypothetical protein ACLOJK_041080 [Asimina triloba]